MPDLAESAFDYFDEPFYDYGTDTPGLGESAFDLSGQAELPPGPPPSTGFSSPTLIPGPYYLDIVFVVNLALPIALQAADPAFWRFGTVSDIKITATGVTTVGLNTIRVFHTKPHNGDIQTVYFPLNGIVSVDGEAFSLASANFTAVALAPVFTILQSVDVRTVRVIFNEAVTDEALVAANYSITPTLRVHSVARVDARTYLLTTDTQVPGTTYTLTAINVRDGSVNIV